MKSLRLAVGLLVVGGAFGFAGCSDDSTTTPDDSAQGGAGAGASVVECKVIGELCHPADSGAGVAHDCHETGHDADPAACAAKFDGCITACVEPDAGEGGGKPDSHCAALGELCHGVDDGSGAAHDCHEIGHVGDAAACAEKFDYCASLCLAAHELAEAGEGLAGAGGAAGATSVGAAGSGAGGAGVSAAGGVGGAGLAGAGPELAGAAGLAGAGGSH